MRNKIVVGFVVIAAGLGIAACTTKTVVVPQAGTPTSTVTPSSAPAPQPTTAQPAPPAPAAPATTPPSSYAQDITNAGIVAPVPWINTTGEQICSDWQSGMSTTQTDQQLLAGGIHPDHLAIFDSITNSDVCPGVTR
jgi:hypothetical protein